MKKVKVTAEVEVPKVPNFLRMTDGQMLPISAVPDADLAEIGRLWTIDLIARSKEQHAAPARYANSL